MPTEQSCDVVLAEMSTNKMIFNLITRIGVHGAKVGLWTPILVVKMKIILFVDISGYGRLNDICSVASRQQDVPFAQPYLSNVPAD